MLFVPRGSNEFNAVGSAAATRPGTTAAYGTSITPATTNAYGTPSQVGDDLTQDCYGLLINANLVFAAGAYRQAAIQILTDPAGGTTWTPLVSDIIVTQANNYAGGGIWYYFPINIASGSAVAVAGRASTNVAFGVNIRYMTAPPDPSTVKRASVIETVGATFGASTVTMTGVTPGTTAEGAWTLLGTTTRRLWWWQIACGHTDTTMGVLNYHVDLATGDTTTVGDPKDIIISDYYVRTTASETFENIPLVTGVEKVVPSGKTIWARVQNAGTNENAGNFQVAAIGCGG